MLLPVLLSPSLLSANFANLERDIRTLEQAGADVLHIDVMDGHFVPNITIGPPVVASLRAVTTLPFDCHLMIEKPDNYIPAFAEAGADWISIHQEVSPHLHRSLSLIKSFGKKSGIVLNPTTPVELCFDAAEYADFILLMSVNPGFGGQKLIASFYHRAEKLRTFLDTNGLENIGIEVDGGIKIDNAAQAVRAGANIIVSGSGLFSGDIHKNMRQIRVAITRHEH